MRYIFRTLAICILVVGTAVTPAAEARDAHQGEVILTVSGPIYVTSYEGAARFDLEMLQTVGSKTFTTTTIWASGVQTFAGVALADLLDVRAVEGGTLRASAMNDYAVKIPVSDAVEVGPIVAYALNRAPMSIRDKGPLWIVYPYDSSEKYRSELIYARSIWHLDRIEVQP